MKVCAIIAQLGQSSHSAALALSPKTLLQLKLKG